MNEIKKILKSKVDEFNSNFELIKNDNGFLEVEKLIKRNEILSFSKDNLPIEEMSISQLQNILYGLENKTITQKDIDLYKKKLKNK